jgi:hypothetical protein
MSRISRNSKFGGIPFNERRKLSANIKVRKNLSESKPSIFLIWFDLYKNKMWK